jgi:hypothetical protein
MLTEATMPGISISAGHSDLMLIFTLPLLFGNMGSMMVIGSLNVLSAMPENSEPNAERERNVTCGSSY